MPIMFFLFDMYCVMLLGSMMTLPASEEAWIKPVMPSCLWAMATCEISKPGMEEQKQMMSPFWILLWSILFLGM